LTGIGLVSGTAGFIAGAATLAFFVGIIYVALGLLRLGLLIINFVSMPVMSGYTSAVALLIAISQVGPMFGYTVVNAVQGYQTIGSLFQNLPNANGYTCLFGLLTLALLMSMLRVRSSFSLS